MLKTLISYNSNAKKSLTKLNKNFSRNNQKTFFVPREMNSLIFLNACEFCQNFFTILKFLLSNFSSRHITVRSITRDLFESNVESWYKHIWSILREAETLTFFKYGTDGRKKITYTNFQIISKISLAEGPYRFFQNLHHQFFYQKKFSRLTGGHGDMCRPCDIHKTSLGHQLNGHGTLKNVFWTSQ